MTNVLYDDENANSNETWITMTPIMINQNEGTLMIQHKQWMNDVRGKAADKKLCESKKLKTTKITKTTKDSR